jgi:hypothetical protein
LKTRAAVSATVSNPSDAGQRVKAADRYAARATLAELALDFDCSQATMSRSSARARLPDAAARRRSLAASGGASRPFVTGAPFRAFGLTVKFRDSYTPANDRSGPAAETFPAMVAR